MWKVLIADDEKLICRLVQALVDWPSLGMTVAATAENGLDALKLIGECNPDILITDIRMPGCNGLELIRQAKEICPELEIIIISGYAHFEYAQSAISYGVGNYILKPINQQELNETLEKIRKRLLEKERISEMELSDHTNSQNDLKRLREGLIKDVLKGDKSFSARNLREIYHFMAQDGCNQAFVLKMDCMGDEMSSASFSVIQEKAGELFESSVSPVCVESILVFSDDFGYGILNYLPEQKDAVRRQMREFLKQLEGNKHLLGSADFSIALGSVEEKPENLALSMENAKMTIAERILEGCGRMLEGVPQASGFSKQTLMNKYVKTAEHAIEVMDMEEISQADDLLRASVMAVPDIRGREVIDIVMSAGNFFLLRAGMEENSQYRQKFERQCMQCGSVEGLFGALKELQKVLLLELQKVRENESSRPIREAKQYIMQNFDKNITLEEVCEYVGFSTTYFSAMFKKETGEGFAKYLTRIRMEEAKNLLRETGLPVSEICERVGYSDRKHFTHTFHKIAGVNPAEYRKLYG